MDWTNNPLVACYFAIEEPCEEDSVIHACQNKAYNDLEEYTDPFRHREVGKFIPRHILHRITTQGGLFTIHPGPYDQFESEDMEKIIIPNSIRSMPRQTLNRYVWIASPSSPIWMDYPLTLNGSNRRETNGSGDDPVLRNTGRNHYSAVNTVPLWSNL
jgi:hypothetical protein